jgi:hypothetical protein
MLALIAAMLSGGVIGVVKGTLSGTGIAATLRDGGVGVVERLSSGTVVSLVDDVFMSVTVVGVPTCWFSTTEILNVLFLKTTSHECCEGGRETETKSPLSPAKNKKMNEVSKEKLTDFDAVRVYSHRGYGERNGELNRQRHVRCDVNPVCTHKCTVADRRLGIGDTCDDAASRHSAPLVTLTVPFIRYICSRFTYIADLSGNLPPQLCAPDVPLR